MVNLDYFQEYITLWQTEAAAAAGGSDQTRKDNAAAGTAHFETKMSTECKTHFTAKAIPANDQTKLYQYDSTNTAVLIGDHTNYIENIVSKDACKLKECTWSLFSDGSADSTYAGSFSIALVS